MNKTNNNYLLPRTAFEHLSEKEFKELSDLQEQKDKKHFEELGVQLERGLCSICGKPIKGFNQNTPCLHWLLKPKSIKKADIGNLLSRAGFYRSNIYLRRIANSIDRIQNINDLESEDGSKIVEETISWKRLRWSFSCSRNDFEGHKNSRLGNEPHFHFALWQDSLPFIRFNDFHINLQEVDTYFLNFLLSDSDGVNIYPYGAEGMNMLFDWGMKEENIDTFLKTHESAENPENAAINKSTLIIADEGETISGEALYQATQKAKEEKTSVAYQIKHSPNFKNANITTVIGAGDGVPDLDKRNKRKKKK
jgi:hypothetical protein